MLIILLLLSGLVSADTYAITKISNSWHYFNDDKRYNEESHEYMAFSYNRWTYGEYVNSYYNKSHLFAYTEQLSQHIFISASLITGYERLMLIPIPSFRYSIFEVSILGNAAAVGIRITK